MNTGYRQLTRSTTDRMIAGVCGGIGKYANMDPTVVRLIAVLLFFLGMGPGILLAYFIMMIIVPEVAVPSSAQLTVPCVASVRLNDPPANLSTST